MYSIKAHPIPGADGKIYTATQMNITATDNLVDSATFDVTLQNAEGHQVAGVQIKLDVQGYAKWEEFSPNYSLGAAKICAEALGLELQ
jgi:hypothetical protein